MEASEKNCFTAGFCECHSFSCSNPARATIFVMGRCFDVGFDGVVEDMGRIFSRNIVVVD